MMTDPSPRYTIYLLTVWFDQANNQENASDPASWRFRLENPRTKEGRGFVGVEALLAGLVEIFQQGSTQMRLSSGADDASRLTPHS